MRQPQQPTLPPAEIEEAVIEQIRSIGLDRSLQAEVLWQTEAGIAEEREILTAERECMRNDEEGTGIQRLSSQ